MKYMGAFFPRVRFSALSYGLLMVGTALLFVAAPVAAQNSAQPDAASALRSAFRDAAREAKSSDELNPAYELLGLADTAQKQNLPQIAAEAAAAFADLVKRATKKALNTGGSELEDTLDQLVDLRFMARSANLPLPQAALDDAMVSLFPPVAAAVQRKVDAAEAWDEKLRYAEDLAELQASATQIMKDELARDMGAAFDLKTTELEMLAGQSEDQEARARMLEDLAGTRQARDERIANANANNMNVVAALMRSQDDKAGYARPQDSGVNVPPELAAGTRSCIETGFSGKPDPVVLRSAESACINSGRVPSEQRCPTRNLAFLCRDVVPGGEKMTYVYRGTPEEFYFEHRCSADNLVAAEAVAASGPAFRNAATALGFTCAPADAP